MLEFLVKQTGFDIRFYDENNTHVRAAVAIELGLKVEEE